MDRWLRFAAVLAVAGFFALSGPAAHAEELDQTDEGISNKGQFGVHFKVGTGYRGILRYNEEYCGQAGEDLCLERSPFSLDLGVSYRATERLELLVEMRLGLESDFGINDATSGDKVRSYSPGLKLYFSDAGTIKFFSTLQLVIDTTDYEQADKLDWGLKNTSGLQIDMHKTVGIYFFFGEIVSWSRWLRLELEGGMGIQARFP
jgi:hypothetical protein